MNLTGQKIKNAYTSLVTTNGTSGFSESTYLYDGKGATAPILIGLTGVDIKGYVAINGNTVIDNTGSWVGPTIYASIAIFTSTEIEALTPTEGQLVYDSTIKVLMYYNGAEWVSI